MILDTNGLSAMADGDPMLEPALRRVAQMFVPTIVLGEYRYGIGQSRYRAKSAGSGVPDRWCTVTVTDEEGPCLVAKH